MSRNVTAEERYRLYRLCECTTCEGTGKDPDWGKDDRPSSRCPDCRGEGRTRDLVATATDPESVGVALVTLAREKEFEGCPLGLLDTQGREGERWLIRPWQASPSARNVSDAARVLARQKGKT